MITEHLVYVPGMWRCPKCEFTLVQSNLNMLDGTVTARDEAGDKCPNCSSALWRVTYKDAYAEVMQRFEDHVAAAPSHADMQMLAGSLAAVAGAAFGNVLSQTIPLVEKNRWNLVARQLADATAAWKRIHAALAGGSGS